MHPCREQHTDVFTLTNNMQEHKYKELCLLIKLQSWKWISSVSFVSVSICGDDRHRKPFSSLLPSCWSRVGVKDSVRANASLSSVQKKQSSTSTCWWWTESECCSPRLWPSTPSWPSEVCWSESISRSATSDQSFSFSFFLLFLIKAQTFRKSPVNSHL